MATDTQTIINENISTVKELRDEIKRLKDSLVTAKEGSQEWTDTVKELTSAQEKLTTINNAHKQSVDAAKDSIVGMEREYKALYDTYKLLSEEQRNSDFGKNMADQLSTLHDKLNETKQGVGNFKDNIGNYTQSVMDAFSKMGISVGGLAAPMKLATNASNGLGKSLKALIANPVGAVIMAIVVAFKALSAIANKVKEAINNNEESQMALKEAMSAFQPVIDAVSNAFDKLGQAVVKVIGFVGEAFTKMREIAAAVTDFLHITDGAKDRVKEQADAYKALAKAQNELVKTKREYEKLNADAKAEVERLREEASETENLDDKKKLLLQAKEKQAEIDQRNIEIAKEEVRILQEQSTHTANSAEDNEKLATAIAKVSEAEAQAAANARQYNKQLDTVNKQQASANAWKKVADEAKKVLEEIKKNSQTEQETREEKYQQDLKALEKYYKNKKKLAKEWEAAILKLTEQYQNDINEINRKKRGEQLAYNRSVMKQMAEMMDYQSFWSGSDFTLNNIEGEFNGFVDAFKNIGAVWDDAKKEFTDIFPPLINETGELTEAAKDLNAEWGVDIRNLQSLNNQVNIYKRNIADLKKADLDDDIKDASISNRFYILEHAEEFENDSKEALERANELWKKYGDERLDLISGAFNKYTDQERKTLEHNKANAEYYWNEIQKIENVGAEDMLQAKLDYYEAVEALRQYDLEKEIEAHERQLELDADLKASKEELFATITSGLQSSMSSINSLLQSEVQEGKLSEQQVKKRKNLMKTLEAISLAAAVAQIAADTASGIMGVWKGFGLEQAVNAETAAATGPAAAATLAALNAKSLTSAGIKTGIIAAAGAANLASAITGSISNFKSINSLGDSGSDNASIYSAPSMSDSTPYSYTRTVQTQQEQDALNQPTIVSVVDIENALNKRKVRTEETTF